jgi:hypothetical protein
MAHYHLEGTMTKDFGNCPKIYPGHDQSTCCVGLRQRQVKPSMPASSDGCRGIGSFPRGIIPKVA